MEQKEEELSMIEQAHKAADRLELANAKMSELLKKQEAMEARKILGGQSEAGNKEPEMTKEEKDRISIKRYFKGTALESAFK